MIFKNVIVILDLNLKGCFGKDLRKMTDKVALGICFVLFMESYSFKFSRVILNLK